DRVPMTSDDESAPVMKKMAMSRMSPMLVTVEKGRFSSTPNSTSSGGLTMRPAPSICWLIAVVPNIANQISEMTEGTRMTTETNWRSVRPREIFAMNIPTKGDHEIHHAQ